MKTNPNPPFSDENRVKIFLADDHSLFRSALRCLLEREPDFLVVGEADNGKNAVEQVLKTHCDVVVMDISMPELNGIEATRLILAQAPEIKVLGLSMYSNRSYVQQMLQAGAVGFLLKTIVAEDLVAAIRAVMNNQFYFSPTVSRIVQIDSLGAQCEPAQETVALLNSKEIEVLRLVSNGKNTKEISCCLQLSTQSVDAYRLRIMKKLKVRSMAELIKYAIREGYTTLDA